MADNYQHTTYEHTTYEVPLIYAYIYMKIKKQMRGDRISGSDIRKIIQKEILCDKDSDKASGNKGLPRRYCYDIIKDIVNLNLIERIGKVGNDPVYKNNNKYVLEVAERLKEWKISEKLRNNKSVIKNLKVALDMLDEDPLYRVVKSQCDKQLKEAFW